MEGGGRVVC